MVNGELLHLLERDVAKTCACTWYVTWVSHEVGATNLTVDMVNGQLLHLLERDIAGPGGSRLHSTFCIYHCNLVPWVVRQVRPQPA